MLKNTFIALAFVAVLGACADLAPKGPALSPELARSITVEEVEVEVLVVDVTSGREIPAAEVQRVLEASTDSLLLSFGARKSVMELRVTEVNILSVGQALFLGGQSVMSRDVALIDRETGNFIVQPITIDSRGGGWAPGGLIGVATMDDRDVELQQLANRFVAQARSAVFGA
ncbi:MAG: hypothetical protein AAF501_13650 [Pseudomonadota bacterium]